MVEILPDLFVVTGTLRLALARLEQAISNLLSNAVQHGAGGAVTVTASGHEDDHVIVTVRNEGEPIPPERLPLLFEPFQKGDKSPAGLGLGLFIVREIIKAHRFYGWSGLFHASVVDQNVLVASLETNHAKRSGGSSTATGCAPRASPRPVLR